MPIVVGQIVVFKCPHCERKEPYTIRKEDAEEAISYRISRIGFFHGDHVLLCGISRTGELVVRGSDSPDKRELYLSNRIYVGGFLILSSESPPGNFRIAVADLNRRTLDIRGFDGNPSEILSVFSREVDRIVAEYASRENFVTFVSKDFMAIKTGPLVAFIRIREEKGLKRVLSHMESLIERDLSSMISAVGNICKDEGEICTLLSELAWYIIFLKEVFPKNPQTETLSRIFCYMQEKRFKVPSETDLENIRMLLGANKIVVSIHLRSELLQSIKPIAIIFGNAGFVDPIYNYRGRDVSLETLLREIKCNELENFLGFIKELNNRGVLEINLESF